MTATRSEIARAVHCDGRNVIRAAKHAVALRWLSVERVVAPDE